MYFCMTFMCVNIFTSYNMTNRSFMCKKKKKNSHALTSLCLVRNKLDVSHCPSPAPPSRLAREDREVLDVKTQKLQH